MFFSEFHPAAAKEKVIQAVRTFFKGFYSLDMSDSDIETLIGRAAAKTRRNAWNRSSRVVKDNLTTENPDGLARFMVGEESTDEYGGVRSGTEETQDIILSKSKDIDISQMSLTEKAKKQAEALEILERLAGRNITNRETEIKFLSTMILLKHI